MPVVRVLRSPQQRRGDDVVAIAKYIGPDLDGFAGNAFNRIAAAVDAGINIFDAETRARRISWGDFQCFGQGRKPYM